MESSRPRPALDRVLQTADRLFYAEGIHATGVDRIAAVAKVSKASLYTYFPSKDDLVAEYLRRRSENWREHLERRIEATGGPARGRILAIFDALGEWFRTDDFHGCPFINAEAECAPDSEAHGVNLVHRHWVRDLFRGLLLEIGVADPDLGARQLSLLYDATMSSAQAEPGEDWVGAAKRAVELIAAV